MAFPSPPLSSRWDATELEMRTTLPPSVASDAGLSADVRRIGDQNYFVFTNALRCRYCAHVNHTECLVRIKGYLKLLKWCVCDISEARRPHRSSCIKCTAGHKPFCHFKCFDMVLGSEWSPEDIRSERPQDAMQAPPKKRRKRNKGVAVALPSKLPLTPAAKSVQIIREAADSPAVVSSPIPQPPSSPTADPITLTTTSESDKNEASAILPSQHPLVLPAKSVKATHGAANSPAVEPRSIPQSASSPAADSASPTRTSKLKNNKATAAPPSQRPLASPVKSVRVIRAVTDSPAIERGSVPRPASSCAADSASFTMPTESKNNEATAAPPFRRPRKHPAKAVRVTRAATDSLAAERSTIFQPASSPAVNSASLAMTSESNDIFRMIVDKFDLNHLMGDRIYAQKGLGR